MVQEMEEVMELPICNVKTFRKDTWGSHPSDDVEMQLLTLDYLMAWCSREDPKQIAIARGEQEASEFTQFNY